MVEGLLTHPVPDVIRFDGGLCVSDHGAGDTGGLPFNRVGRIGVGQIIMGGQPQRGTAPCGTTGDDDAIRIDVPFRRLAAQELQGTRSIHDGSWQRVGRSEPIGDVGDGNPLIKISLASPQSLFRPMPPTAAVDIDDQGCRLPALSLPEIESLFRQWPVGDIGKSGGLDHCRRLLFGVGTSVA